VHDFDYECWGFIRVRQTTSYLNLAGNKGFNLILIFSAVQKALFRVAFHGGFGNVWGALMSIPEVTLDPV
jgi:hypothetical protein